MKSQQGTYPMWTAAVTTRMYNVMKYHLRRWRKAPLLSLSLSFLMYFLLSPLTPGFI